MLVGVISSSLGLGVRNVRNILHSLLWSRAALRLGSSASVGVGVSARARMAIPRDTAPITPSYPVSPPGAVPVGQRRRLELCGTRRRASEAAPPRPAAATCYTGAGGPHITVTTVEATGFFFPSDRILVLWAPRVPCHCGAPPCEASKLADKWRGLIVPATYRYSAGTCSTTYMSRRAGVWLRPAGRSPATGSAVAAAPANLNICKGDEHACTY